MGHDISGYNKAGETIAYVRFSMGNYNATLLYNLLDADDFYAGVSGSGDSSTFSKQQIEKALDAYKQICSNDDPTLSKSDFLVWEQKEMMSFLLNCVETALKEESVRVFFG